MDNRAGNRKGPEMDRTPAGLEELLWLASTNDEFKEALIRERVNMASALNVFLTPSEAAILADATESQLREMTETLTPHSRMRRKLLAAAASAALGFLSGTSLSSTSCKSRSAGRRQPRNRAPASSNKHPKLESRPNAGPRHVGNAYGHRGIGTQGTEGTVGTEDFSFLDCRRIPRITPVHVSGDGVMALGSLVDECDPTLKGCHRQYKYGFHGPGTGHSEPTQTRTPAGETRRGANRNAGKGRKRRRRVVRVSGDQVMALGELVGHTTDDFDIEKYLPPKKE
jgi:hypothetical protein